MTTNKRWLLLRASEEGNPLRWLGPAELNEVLADPGSYGIDRFVTLDDLTNDPNYWPSDIGVLLKVQVVIPVPAGAYRLPDECEPPAEPFEPTRDQVRWLDMDAARDTTELVD